MGSRRVGFIRTKSGNSETPPQKLRNTNTEIDFLSFRVGLFEFPSQTFRVSEVEGFPRREGPCRFQYVGATQLQSFILPFVSCVTAGKTNPHKIQECMEYGGTGCTGSTWTKLVPIEPSWTILAKLVVILLCFAYLERHIRPSWTMLVQYAFPPYSVHSLIMKTHQSKLRAHYVD